MSVRLPPSPEQVITDWKDMAIRDYSFYVEYAHKGRYMPARHTRYICRKLQQVERGKIKRLIILLPPRHSKSMTVTETFPSYFIGRNPERRVIAVSYGDTLARKFGRLNRQKIEEHAAFLFGVRVSRGSSSITNWTVDRKKDGDIWEVSRGGMISTGIGGAITGEGADCLLIDDPVKNRKEADSEVYQEMVWSEYQNTLLTRLQPDGSIVIILTRWNERDLVGRILATDKGTWTIVRLPAIAEEPNLGEEADPLGRMPGEALWPEYGFDEKWAVEKKIAVGTRVWTSLFQQSPTEAEGTLVKSSWWKFYKVLPPVIYKLQTIDTGFKKGEDNDPSCCLTSAACENGYYFIDGDNRKLEYPELLVMIKMNWAKHDLPDEPLNKLVIEDEASGQSAIQSIQYETSLPVFGHDAKGKKEQVRMISALIEAGRVYLPENEDGTMPAWVAAFIEQWNKFPNGRHDEWVDVGCMALIHLRLSAKGMIHTSEDGKPESAATDDKAPHTDRYGSVIVEDRQGDTGSGERVILYLGDIAPMYSDRLLSVCKEEGHVPFNCRLVGDIVMDEVREGRDPCQSCYCDRDVCRGREKEKEEAA